VTLQTPLVQSEPLLHFLLTGHFGQKAPPQSVSVSVPFFTRSVHFGAWQVTLQTPLLQSVANEQVLPATHFGHIPPPQSTSVSEPFF
jgi:hypothetical protein